MAERDGECGTGTPGPRDTGTPGHRDTGTLGHGDSGTPGPGPADAPVILGGNAEGAAPVPAGPQVSGAGAGVRPGLRTGSAPPDDVCSQALELSQEEKLQLRKEKKQQKKKKKSEKGSSAEPAELGAPPEPRQPRGERRRPRRAPSGAAPGRARGYPGTATSPPFPGTEGSPCPRSLPARMGTHSPFLPHSSCSVPVHPCLGRWPRGRRETHGGKEQSGAASRAPG